MEKPIREVNRKSARFTGAFQRPAWRLRDDDKGLDARR